MSITTLGKTLITAIDENYKKYYGNSSKIKIVPRNPFIRIEANFGENYIECSMTNTLRGKLIIFEQRIIPETGFLVTKNIQLNEQIDSDLGLAHCSQVCYADLEEGTYLKTLRKRGYQETEQGLCKELK